MIDNERTVSRDIPATIVPYGDQVTIPEGTRVTITHRLGGNFTVTWEGGMAQINGIHGDAIGERKTEAVAAREGDHEGPPDEDPGEVEIEAAAMEQVPAASLTARR